MNAIKLLESQHRKVEKLFKKIADSKNTNAKERLFTELADSLAIHASIEEHHFYPAVRAHRTEDILLESVEEHLAIKRVLSDLLDTGIEEESFDAKLKVLKEQVEHHVGEEEDDLFPKVAKLLDAERLEAIGQEMTAEQAELEKKGDARMAVPSETDEAASIA